MFEPGEWIALSLALVLLLVAGAWHLTGLLSLKALIGRLRLSGHVAVLIVFWGLALLHVSEIVIGAMVYGAAINWFELGTVLEGYGDSPAGLLYLSGVTFATLGYTEQTVNGPLRLMTMMHSLSGFMLITWSATYVYSIWEESFRQSGDDGDDREKQD